MNRIYLVFKNELVYTVARRSFVITLFILPVITFVIMAIITTLEQGQTQNFITELFAPSQEVTIEGFVDSGKVLQTIPDELQDWLIPFDNEQDAVNALEKGEIDAYYLISSDYVETGEITYIRTDFNPLGGLENTGWIEMAIAMNLLNNDVSLADKFFNIMELDAIRLTNGPVNGSQAPSQTEQQRDPDNSLTFFLPYIVTFLFYIVIMGAATLMLNSIANEKQNRVLEIILTSATPIQMLSGKIAALGLVGLLQTIIWSGTGMILLRISGRTFNLPISYQLPASILFWGILFFLLGYAIYASLMSGIGALVPNLRDASQATLIVILPLMIPLMLISNLIMKPNGVLATVLSLFPLTAPVVMMTRLAATEVPLWQIILSIFLMAATAILIIRAVAGMFRAQILLSGQGFKLKTFLRALIGQEVSQ